MHRTALIYVRVSSVDQLKNMSLETQERLCIEYCKREGWSVDRVFTERGESAKSMQRTALQELLEYVARKSGIDYVVMYDVRRFARNLWEYSLLKVKLKGYGIGLRYATRTVDDETPEGVLSEGIDALFAHYDNAKRAKIARDGMTTAARSGRWLWQAPLGYRLAARDAEGRHRGVEIDPDTAPLVRRGFELVAGGVNIRAAHAELVAAGLRLHGKPVRYEVVRRLLRSPIYAGRIECASLGVYAASSSPAIVDEATWLRVQSTLDRGGVPYRRRPEASSEFPLRGVVRCACGRRLVAYKARGKSGRRWPYYRCTRCERNFPAARIEASWLELLGRIAARPEHLVLLDRLVSRMLENRASQFEERIARARRRLTAAEGRIERLLELRADGEISKEEHAAARDRAATDRDAARLEIIELTAPLDVDAGTASEWGRRLLTKPAEIWSELGAEHRGVFAERVFPAGVSLGKNETLANPTKSLLFLPFTQPSGTEYSDGGLLEVSCEPAGEIARILDWRRDLKSLELSLRGRVA